MELSTGMRRSSQLECLLPTWKLNEQSQRQTGMCHPPLRRTSAFVGSVRNQNSPEGGGAQSQVREASGKLGMCSFLSWRMES